MNKDNMNIWNAVKKTDPAYTKSNNQGGRSSTSINTNYMVMRATEAFGPIGEGWGFRVLEERFDKTEPIIKDGEILTVDGQALWMLDHTIRLELWHGDRQNTVEQFGHTPYRYYSSKSKRIIVDADYGKKTLSDALKKCLSLLGVCADIFLGEFDDYNYQQEAAAEAGAKKAVEKSASHLSAVQEIRDMLARSAKEMERSTVWNQAEAIYHGAVSEFDIKSTILGLDESEKADIIQMYFTMQEKLGAKK